MASRMIVLVAMVLVAVSAVALGATREMWVADDAGLIHVFDMSYYEWWLEDPEPLPLSPARWFDPGLADPIAAMAQNGNRVWVTGGADAAVTFLDFDGVDRGQSNVAARPSPITALTQVDSAAWCGSSGGGLYIAPHDGGAVTVLPDGDPVTGLAYANGQIWRTGTDSTLAAHNYDGSPAVGLEIDLPLAPGASPSSMTGVSHYVAGNPGDSGWYSGWVGKDLWVAQSNSNQIIRVGSDQTITLVSLDLDATITAIAYVDDYRPLPYCFNDDDGDVDLDDFVILKTNFGTTSGATCAQGDYDGDGDVDLDDFVILKQNFGTGVVPEPSTAALLGLAGLSLRRRRRRV